MLIPFLAQLAIYKSSTRLIQGTNTMRNFILLLLTLFSILPLLVLSKTHQGNKFSECTHTSYRCGGDDAYYDISYPFRVQDMPKGCGLPGFDVACKHKDTDEAMLVLEISDKKYKVGNISYENQTINLVDTDFLGDTCPRAFLNTTFNTSLFSYVEDDFNLTIYSNCSSQLSEYYPNLRKVSCKPGSDLNNLPYYCLLDDDPNLTGELSRICKSTAQIPFLRRYQWHLEGNGVLYPEELRYGFDLNWTSDATKWCKGCKDTGGICVSDLESPGKPSCACDDGSIANGTCSSRGKGKKTIIESVSAAVLGFLVVCLLLALYFCKHRMVSNSVIFWKKNLNNNQKIEAFLEDYGSINPRRYSYSNVKKIIKAFQEKLGQGGYGTVFKGTLDNGHMVAVKILNDSKGDGEEFINEVASIGRTSHVNVVSLLGFCYEGSKRALVYDFMCNGSLDKLLNSGMSKSPLDWEKLYQIAIGIARGLEYLHCGCNARIVHFDIKPHNILLDQDFCPKISDFGLAKLCLKKESMISIAGCRGTIGYIAPEVFSRNFGVVSSKSDVYSYGMMLLEITGGRKNPNEGVENSSEMYFPHWIYAQLQQNGDLSSCGVTAESEETVRKMVLVGLWCIQTMPQNRPSMCWDI